MKSKEIAFCEEFLVDLAPKQAAIRAGYAESYAREAHEWLKEGAPREKRVVRMRVEEMLAARSARVGVNADRVVRELARLAFADITDVVDTNWATVKPDATKDDTAVIASIKIKSGDDFIEREVKLCDKVKALELLGKHLGMYTDRVVLTDDRPTIVDNIPGGEGNG